MSTLQGSKSATKRPRTLTSNNSQVADLTNLNKDDFNSMVEDFNSKLLSALDANAPSIQGSHSKTLSTLVYWRNTQPEKDCETM